MARFNNKNKFWQRYSGQALFRLIIAVSAFAISYEGMSQGIMGAVTVAPEFMQRMGYGNEQGEVTKPALQGGISSIYYAGSLVGGFWAGSFSDKFGRVAGIRMAALICFFGVVLQTASVNLPMLLVARIVAGIGVSFILCIAPAWTAELSPASHRGNTIALTFLANFTGISVAAWIGFATSFTDAAGGQFRWRFTFATQLIPVALITVGSFLIPESPRWLVKAHRHEEALEIFAHVLGDGDAANAVVQTQYRDVLQTVQAEENAPTSSYVKMFFGIGSGDVHLGRRIQLAFWLQVLMQYGTGIAAVVIYAGSIFRTAGFSDVKSSWLTALCLTVGILGTFIAALTLDRVGRRRTLYWGSIVLSIVLFLIGGLFRAALAYPARQSEFATASVAFVFIYVLVFSSSWLLIPFIYPTEIFPTWVRAKGNAFGVAGWAVGYGGGSLLVPVMFAGIQEKTYYIFAVLLLIYIPMVNCFLPETSGRSLEAIDHLFASKSPFTWNEEKEFRLRMESLHKQSPPELFEQPAGDVEKATGSQVERLSQ